VVGVFSLPSSVVFLFHHNLEKSSKTLPGSCASAASRQQKPMCGRAITAFPAPVTLLELELGPGVCHLRRAVGCSLHVIILQIRLCETCRKELQSSASLSLPF